MNTFSQWLGLSFVVCSAACGSTFQANDSATGGSASGGDASGGDASGGSVNTAGSNNGGRGGKSGKGGSGGSVSAGGDIGIAGNVSVGGAMGVSGGSGAGGIVGNAGSTTGGGMSGGSASGGAAGSATAGAGGGSGANCTQLWSSYQDLVAKTAVCDAGTTVECVANSTIVDQCNCAVPFNHNSASLSGAKKALQDWKDAGCVFKPCGCLTQGTPSCLITSGTTAYTCQFGPAVIQM